MAPQDWVTEVLTDDEFLDYVFEFHEVNPKDSPVDIIFRHINSKTENASICLTAFHSDLASMLIEAEIAADQYGSLPYSGGYFEQPQFVLEAFKIIRVANSMYFESKKKRDRAKAAAKAAADRAKGIK